MSKAPFIAGLLLGAALLIATAVSGHGITASDVFFCLGSGVLLLGILRTVSNLKFFAPALWGGRMLKRLFRGEARTGREETDDYAAYRERMGGHGDAPVLLVLGIALVAVSALLAFL